MIENENTITCPRCGSKISPAYKFCPNCGVALFGDEVGGGDNSQQAGAQLTAPTAERRQLTVMFCDLVGSVALSLELDPEDFRDVVQQYQKAASDCIDRFEGYIAQYLGDGILAYFGYPVAHEDEAVRAVRAGREIIKSIEQLGKSLHARFGIDLAVRIGIDTGIVVVGEMGTGARRENLALGETPNLAARLQSLAPENGLVIGEATYKMVSAYYEGKDLGPYTLRGTSHQERVYEITDERLLGSPLDLLGRHGPVSAVGREREVQKFEICWGAVEKGEGRILLLHGEAGIGKSHVVQVFRQHLDGREHRRAECRCSPYLRNTPLHPFTEWLGSVLNFYPEQSAADRLEMIEMVARRNKLADPEAVPLLASLLNVPLDGSFSDPGFSPSLRKDRIEQVLMDLLFRIGDDGPLLLIVEDIQWADPTTRTFIQRFAGQIRERRLLLLLTTRNQPDFVWSPGIRVDTLAIDRLNRSQVEAVIEYVADGKRLPDKIIDQIIERTDGVPLFVQELTRMVLESGQVVECDDCYEMAEDVVEISIPATLNDSLMARLDRILPVKEVAQVCSTLGREFSFELARVVSRMNETDLALALTRLVDAELLLVEGSPPHSRYMFRHALIQEAAYESVLKTRRQQYHDRVADHLIAHPSSKESRPEIIAQHLTRAGRRDRAATYWLIAGQEAHERWANQEAVDYFTRGLALLAGLKSNAAIHHDRFFLQAGLGVASIQLKGYTHQSVLSALERACSYADDLPDKALIFPVVRGIWAHYTVIGEHRKAESLADQLSELADLGELEERRIDADLARASTAFWRGRVREAEREFGRILTDHADSTYLPPPALAAQHPFVGALAYRSVAQWYLGYPVEAEQSGRKAIECAAKVKHPFSSAFAHGFYGLLHTYLGNREEVARTADQAIEISSRYGFPFWMGIGNVMKSWAQSDTDPDAAIAGMNEALTGLHRAGVQIWTAYPSALVAELMVSRGKVDEGIGMLETVVSQARQNDEGYFLPEIIRIEAKCLQESGRSAEAGALRREALMLAEEQGARPIILRILLDLAKENGSFSAELDELLRTTCDSFEEGVELPEIRAARQICAA